MPKPTPEEISAKYRALEAELERLGRGEKDDGTAQRLTEELGIMERLVRDGPDA